MDLLSTNTIKYPMDEGRSWVILVSAMLSMFVTIGLLFGSFGVFFVTFRDYFQVENAQASLVTAIPAAMLFLSGI